MRLKSVFAKLQNKKDAATPFDVAVLRNWYKEKYESAIIQYNLLFIILVASLIIIAFSVFVIRYVRSTRSIEPFIIEIERKTGVLTVVDLVTIAAYSANTSIKRYFVWRYITVRKEYFLLSTLIIIPLQLEYYQHQKYILVIMPSI